MFCKYCKNKGNITSDQHFMFCSVKCKEEQENKSLQLRKEQYSKHNPWDRMTEKEKSDVCRFLGVNGPVRWGPELFQVPYDVEVSETPHMRQDGEIDKRSAGFRKCGNCGEKGHNTRTCKKVV